MDFELHYFGLNSLIQFLENNGDKLLRVGFSNPHSYRGYYEQLAFEPITSGAQSCAHALEIVRPCLGQVFEGYKGSEYTMHGYTECWFAWYGQSGGQQIWDMLMELLVM